MSTAALWGRHILTGAVSIEETGKRIYDEVIAVANGRYTYTEFYDTAQSTISVEDASF